jgi:catechol 2,3-dioxygenase
VILRLSHTDLAVDDLDAAEAFYVETLGFVAVERVTDGLYLRGVDEFDAWSLKLSLGTAGLRSFTFRVASETALDELTTAHQALHVPVAELPAGHEPGLGRTVRVRTPDGFTVNFVHAVEEVDFYDRHGTPRHPQRQAHRHHGVPPARLHHVNLRVVDVDASLRYWGGQLRFSTSEYVRNPDESTRLAWIRRSHASHDVALGQADAPGMHHLAFAVADPARLLHACDVLADAGYADALEFGPARHGVSGAMALYMFDPAGHRVELFAGDYVRDLDRRPLAWTWADYLAKGRMWWGPKPPASFAQKSSALAPAAASAISS